MLNPLLQLIATQPELLAHHAQGYARLLRQELGEHLAWCQRQAFLRMAALCAAGVGAVLSEVAVMLYAVTPSLDAVAVAVLVITPTAVWLASLACWMAARRSPVSEGFALLAAQCRQDWDMLRELESP
jgi:hypothetical protein